MNWNSLHWRCEFGIHENYSMNCFCLFVGTHYNVSMCVLKNIALFYLRKSHYIAIWLHSSLAYYRRCVHFLCCYFYRFAVLMDAQWWSSICNDAHLNQCRLSQCHCKYISAEFLLFVSLCLSLFMLFSVWLPSLYKLYF